MKLEEMLSQFKTKGLETAKTVQALIDHYGGVQGFVKEMKSVMTSENMKTWIKDGKQLVLTNEQVQKILGDERLKQIASKLSTTPEKITQTLAQHLPGILERIEKLAPGGKIPENNLVGKILNIAKAFTAGANKSDPKV